MNDLKIVDESCHTVLTVLNSVDKSKIRIEISDYHDPYSYRHVSISVEQAVDLINHLLKRMVEIGEKRNGNR